MAGRSKASFSSVIKTLTLALGLPASFSFSISGQAVAQTARGPSGRVGQARFWSTECLVAQIFGFDIDQNGNLGVLTEATSCPAESWLAAVETFDQTTGEIVRVVKPGAIEG